ncbi:MAG TPA: PIN domain-containing protein [Candidatus Limnocylindrales bacterium]|nr:PIN domain-containing protein [Candidatus Limnocylindrales bacterium]
MKIIVDSSVFIDHIRGDPRAMSWLEETILRGVDPWSITPVRTEVLAGMHKDEDERTHRLFGLVSWQDITIPIADRAGELRRAGPATGGDTVDYLLAAAAELLSAELATMNVRHFPMIEGLEAPY